MTATRIYKIQDFPGPESPLPLVPGATCSHVDYEYCKDRYNCDGGPRGYRCAGHRTFCPAPAWMVIDAGLPDAVARSYSCVEHFQEDLIDANNYPPDPGYTQAISFPYEETS